MKIIVLHGDNTLESYQRLIFFIKAARKRGWDVIRITDNNQSISEALISESLFEKEKLVVVEGVNILSKNEINWIKEKKDKIETTLVIYHRGVISKTLLNSLPKVDKTEEFKLPKLIWSFLDSIYPGNSKNCLLLLHEIVKTEPIEFVFSLLAKQVRDIYWVKIDQESLPYPSWRKGKLIRQSQKFSDEQLKELISELAKSDIKSKTSKLNLLDELDFIIAIKLEYI